MWRHKDTGEWFHIEATFYPKTNLWITENGTRRKITKAELNENFAMLEL